MNRKSSITLLLALVFIMILLNANFAYAQEVTCDPCFTKWFDFVSYDSSLNFIQLRNKFPANIEINAISSGSLQGVNKIGVNQTFIISNIQPNVILSIFFYRHAALDFYSDTAVIRNKQYKDYTISCNPCFNNFQIVNYTGMDFNFLRLKVNTPFSIDFASGGPPLSTGNLEGITCPLSCIPFLGPGDIISISGIPQGSTLLTVKYFKTGTLELYSDTAKLSVKPSMDVSLSPTSISINMGETKSTDIIIQNNKNIEDAFSITLNPSEVSGVGILLNESSISVPANSQKTVKLYFNATINQEFTKNLVVSAKSTTDENVFDDETLTLKVVLKTCPVCPSPTEWSTCTDGKQTRTNYRCSAETNYQCQGYRDDRKCCPTCPLPSAWSTCINIVTNETVLNIQTRTNYKCGAETNYECQSYIEEKACVPPPECPVCPQPSDWSSCIESKQTRTNYRCDATTNYQCQAYTEEKSCMLCGNGKIDAGENCDTCPVDAGCKGGLLCYQGQCVACIQSSDCVGKKVWSGEYFCLGNIIMEKGSELSGECINHECVGSAVTTREVDDCRNRFCQDGHCGCSEGYEACQASGKCEKTSVLVEGDPCKCHFQCKSNFCSKSGICMKAMDIIFSSQKGVIRVGEATKLTISADNTLDQDIQTKLTINLGTGASMSGVIAGQDCSGNQCTGTVTIPAKGRENIAIDLTGESAGSVELTATVTAEIGGRPYQKSESTNINITECSNGKCEQGETQENCCTDCGGCPKGIFQKITNWLKGLLAFLGFKL